VVPVTHSLVFGNAKTKREKGQAGEVLLEQLSSQALKDGFSVDATRLTIEPEGTKSLTFKFDPSNSLNAVKKFAAVTKQNTCPVSLLESLINTSAVETSLKCTLKGGYTPQDREGISFTIILKGRFQFNK